MASGSVDANSRFVKNCIERADGNLLFLEQLLRSAEDADENAVPGSIQSLILARMDRVDAADKEALQAASAIGQRFSLDALRHLIGDPRYSCSVLLERQLVRPEGHDYLFAHAMVREGVYSSLLDAKKRELYQRAAEWFEDVDHVLRAEHLDCAENPEAVNAYLDAADIEAKQFRFKMTLRFIGRGREIARNDIDIFRLLMLEGTCQSDIGNPAEAVDVYRQARDVATDDIGRCLAAIAWPRACACSMIMIMRLLRSTRPNPSPVLTTCTGSYPRCTITAAVYSFRWAILKAASNNMDWRLTMRAELARPRRKRWP